MKNLLFTLSLSGILIFIACGNRPSQNDAATQHSNALPTPSVSPASTESLPKIVAFGDSLTAGYGLAANESYPAILQEKLRADGFTYEVVNAGVSGDTSAGGLRRIDWSLEGDVRVLILELGANDLLRGQPVSEMKKNLSAIIERAKERNVKVLLAGIYTLTNAGPDYQKEIHEAFQSLAREQNVPLIPFFLEGVAGNPKLNQPDGIHPTAEGTRIVAENVYRYLRPMIEKQNTEHRTQNTE